jgi:hypothetical protein
MNLTINDFLDLFADADDQQVALYDINTDTEIYRGTRDEMHDDMLELEICSIDTLHEATTVLTLNVDTSNS